MSFMIAAAGTGGHVFPGLAVGDALVASGVNRDEIMFIGGSRLEADVYPSRGYPFLSLDLRGLKRSLSISNLTLPGKVWRARNRISNEIRGRGARCVLGLGGYVTIPAALASRRARVPLMVAEQNAVAGLANRVAGRWASRVFTSFPETSGLPGGEWVGNPVRSELAGFARGQLRGQAISHYGLNPDLPVVGVFGGSLGAAAINRAVADLAAGWSMDPIQIVHLVGEAHFESMRALPSAPGVAWRRIGFEDRMDLFFAAADLVLARAGGAVAEITATGTPSILVPGDFGSAGHQSANAAYLASSGAAVVLAQQALVDLPAVTAGLIGNQTQLSTMSEASAALARPDAAKTIARAMIEASA
ncbi:MAG: UDP-N-acetylglucosamine--N-acetylmuramyl-(pentapeptide) pyrophosphoryl-undecaprenol N-acetylglucosamine transferase [Acidimicrobiia bacterium]|nr:UDP-N-acetylglucosamine--N-acetylmuramyl-(pentapeptide) pyrophosphoryl-undecaprenol N-acetylglucosamine transferase [Acidimicrobiia bacterium]